MKDFEEFRDADQWPRVLLGDQPPADYPVGLPFVANRYVRYKKLSQFSVAVWTLGSSAGQVGDPESEPTGKLAELLATTFRMIRSFPGAQHGDRELKDFVDKVVDLAMANSWRLAKGKHSTAAGSGIHLFHMERGQERLGIFGHALGKVPLVTAIYHPQGFADA